MQILLGHVTDGVVRAYAGFVSACGAWHGLPGVEAGQGRAGEVESATRVRELVRAICVETGGT